MISKADGLAILAGGAAVVDTMFAATHGGVSLHEALGMPREVTIPTTYAPLAIFGAYIAYQFSRGK